ncbi:MAE_28990/MAE_18760 family HEPN-like nuclease [Janthinobacterium sp. PSPC3-1]|uniref:MAE_28990/MAE_18760 family HEPN-like nuclease n=1 Tax=Janthinobacterium sp. PSPC3-1 TaxID=2804653 RepID=UPI003CF33540
MTTLLTTLSERKDDFNFHLALAQSMEGRILAGEPVSIGETALTARHLLTMKSGLIVHLYNVVEALMSRTLDEVGSAVKSAPPEKWSATTLKEWLRFSAALSLEGTEETRLGVVHSAALKLLKAEPLGNLQFKKPSGTWSDKLIFQFSKRLNVSFDLTPEMAIKIQKSPIYRDKSPLEFLADRRNAIAHGRRSFEDGANDMSLSGIEELANVTLDYMEFAVTAFQKFVDEKHYMAVVN